MAARLNQPDIIRNWKYWPTLVLYLPVIVYVLFIAIFRTGRLFFFAAANPGVPLGGLAGDSKYDILRHVPSKNLPESIFIDRSTFSFAVVREKLRRSSITFPLIVKPDIGEGGFLVKKIADIGELQTYHYAHDMSYIIQELISLPMEVSILVHTSGSDFKISSFIEKKYLQIVGDGCSTIKELLEKGNNTRFRKEVFEQLRSELSRVPLKNEKYSPLCIGNWNYGTLFINRKNDIDFGLRCVLHTINNEVGLFNYARYDIKCRNMEDLRNGRFYVLEINGVKGEPLHIYDENLKLHEAYADIFRHWNCVLKISRRNIALGARCPGVFDGIRIICRHQMQKYRAMKPRPVLHTSLPVHKNVHFRETSTEGTEEVSSIK